MSAISHNHAAEQRRSTRRFITEFDEEQDLVAMHEKESEFELVRTLSSRGDGCLRAKAETRDDTMAMDRFADMPWTQIAPHADEKCVRIGDRAVRLVRFEPDFLESDWCERPHFGYVVDGQLSIEFEDSTATYTQGDYIALTGTSGSRHRAVVSEIVTLFLVEPESS